jgi:polysaccharide export outer membrane protein
VAKLRIVGIVCLLFVLGGCSLIPTSGPQSSDIRAAQDYSSLPYAFVPITPTVLDVLTRTAPRFETAYAGKRKPRSGPAEIRFGIGDILTVTLFEAAAGGLFIPLEAGVRPGNFIALPPQAVDNKGNISIPYAGSIQAAGRTAVELQEAIVSALKDRALRPQAIVSLTEQRASSVTVLGEGVGSIRFPLSANGERVLDAIARAGLQAQGFDLWVMLERQGRRETLPFGALVYDPANNIYLRPQDTIYIYRQPQTFLAFGATGRQAQIPFEAWRISLAESAAKAGGLNDTQADPGSVFIYRGETREVAELLGVDCSRFSGPIIPIVYNLSLRDPAGYFLATRFEMRNKDVIYISNAISVDASKIMNYMRLIIATAQDPINYAIGIYTLKSASQGGASAIIIDTPPITP